MSPRALVDDLLMATMTVPMGEIDTSARVYEEHFDWVRRWSGTAGSLGASLNINPQRQVAYLAPAAEHRGWVRMIEGPSLPPPPLSTWGWNALEICVTDVEAMFELTSSSKHFRVNGLPADLAISDEPPGQRAMQAVGPHGIQVFLTQILHQIPGFELMTPPEGAAVGGVFIAVLAAESYERSKRFYEEALGMELKLEFNFRPTAAREHNWPEGDTIPIAALTTSGHTLIELDGYGGHARPRPTEVGELPPAIGFATFAVRDIEDALIQVRRHGGVVAGGPVAVEHPPYDGRGSVLIKAPEGEFVELVGG